MCWEADVIGVAVTPLMMMMVGCVCVFARYEMCNPYHNWDTGKWECLTYGTRYAPPTP